MRDIVAFLILVIIGAIIYTKYIKPLISGMKNKTETDTDLDNYDYTPIQEDIKIGAKISEKLSERVDAYCLENNMSKSKLIRIAIDEYITNQSHQ